MTSSRHPHHERFGGHDHALLPLEATGSIYNNNNSNNEKVNTES